MEKNSTVIIHLDKTHQRKPVGKQSEERQHICSLSVFSRGKRKPSGERGARLRAETQHQLVPLLPKRTPNPAWGTHTPVRTSPASTRRSVKVRKTEGESPPAEGDTTASRGVIQGRVQERGPGRRGRRRRRPSCLGPLGCTCKGPLLRELVGAFRNQRGRRRPLGQRVSSGVLLNAALPSERLSGRPFH